MSLLNHAPTARAVARAALCKCTGRRFRAYGQFRFNASKNRSNGWGARSYSGRVTPKPRHGVVPVVLREGGYGMDFGHLITGIVPSLKELSSGALE